MPGGVCAVLNYEVDQMAEYVAEMATRIVMPRSSVNAAFRKFVSQILTSTRLPSTTILLGMNYLAKRMNMMNAAGPTKTTEGQVWRMLTTALLLGSKFLDDNTFQNKSWSDVSGIPVQELNTLEYEWLGTINWCLYVNLDESKDYQAWLKNWEDWQDNKRRQQQAQATHDRLASLVTPIDTDVSGPRNPHVYSPWHQQQVSEYERLSNMKRSQFTTEQSYRAPREAWGYQPTAWAPLTPPDSGYGTPEYTNSAASTSSPSSYDWINQAIMSSATAQRQFRQGQHQQQAPPSAYHSTFHHSSRNHVAHPGYFNFSQSIWEPNIADCNCQSCVGVTHNKTQPYFASQNFGQPVIG